MNQTSQLYISCPEQRRLKRDSAHAQKCCTCSGSSLQRPFQRDHHKDQAEIREALTPKMLVPCLLRRVVLTVPLVLVVGLLFLEPVRSDQEAGTAIPAESRPCVDCHAFEFMQRALQDLKKTAYNLDTRTETLLLQVEKRNLCDCVTANLLN
ncbi:NELL2-interacting cell ontogeny regulator 1-like [Pogoniulus pusillus]|uniref:NELL2-interacting cell ontogeny regulator 1-like n=1 Tax=Pogoniulus pusillus TaxID=488313 RepID=UPI0030B95556